MSRFSNRSEQQKTRHLEVPHSRAGQRLDNFLIRHLKGIPKSAIYRLIRTGQVRVNGRRAKPQHRVTTGDVVRLPPASYDTARSQEPSAAVCSQVEKAIIHEDDDILVVDKPSGIAVHAGSGLPWGLIDVARKIRPEKMPELVHRIDRETSGCLVIAFSREALTSLSRQFREGRVQKRYLCLLDGMMGSDVIDVDQPILTTRKDGEKHMEADASGVTAHSIFERIEQFSSGCYAGVSISTGRTHQIRAHAAFLGLPLAGDRRYGDEERMGFWRQAGLKRLFLHAAELEFETPGGEVVHYSAPLADDLRSCLDNIANFPPEAGDE